MSELDNSWLIDKEKSGPLFFYAGAWMSDKDYSKNLEVLNKLRGNGFFLEE